MKNLINLTPEQVKYFEKIMKIHNKIDEISNENELHKLLYESRILHGSILQKIHYEYKKEMINNDYYNLSIYDSLNDLVKNTIGQIEIKLQNSNNNNNNNNNNNTDEPIVTDIRNSPNSDDNNNKWLVFFHANWCGHCLNFMPIWNKFESQMINNNIKLAKIDVENKKYNNITEKYKEHIKGYPTILYIDKIRIEEYKGARTIDALTRFINNNK